MRGGTKAVYDDIAKHARMMSFAPLERDRGRMFSARAGWRLASLSAGIPEADLPD
jgi:hypothetical protein